MNQFLCRIIFSFSILTGFLVNGAVTHAQSAGITTVGYYTLSTCAQVSNLTGISGANYMTTAPITCSGPININVSISSLTFAPGSSLSSSSGVTINGTNLGNGPITNTNGVALISIHNDPFPVAPTPIISIHNDPFPVGSVPVIGGPVGPIGPAFAIPLPVNADLYIYDYDTGRALQPNTRHIGIVLGLGNTTVPSNPTYTPNNATSISVLSYTAVDFKGGNVNLMLPSSLNLNTPFNFSMYGEQKNVLGPFSISPLTSNSIMGGLVVNIVLQVAGDTLSFSVSKTTAFTN